MNFNKHYNLRGAHSFLSPSSYHWLNYTDDKMITVYQNMKAQERGTRLHAFAEECINLGQKLPRSNKTLNLYVNDAISYHMTPEQVLYYSDNCFGTADSICFRNKFLRVHDLKTGTTPAHMEQLLIYEALFCLEYHYKPGDISSELRIYQNDEVLCYIPEADEIAPIMDKIITFDKLIARMKAEVEGGM